MKADNGYGIDSNPFPMYIGDSKISDMIYSRDCPVKCPHAIWDTERREMKCSYYNIRTNGLKICGKVWKEWDKKQRELERGQ